MTASRHGSDWRTSTYSANADACVEVRNGTWGAQLRDTKNRSAGTVEFTDTQWADFVNRPARG